MSIFGRLKDKLFGTKLPAASAAAAPSAAPTVAPAMPAVTPLLDVEAVLTFMASQNTQTLHWQTSIVDLMKLLGMESSLAERRELAGELGYTGDTQDSAAMNIWLHNEVIQRIKDNGGQIRDMTD